MSGVGTEGHHAALGFAIVGSGVIAGVIATSLAAVEGCELRLVVGRNAESARLSAAQHGARWSGDVGGWLHSPAAILAMYESAQSGRPVRL